MAIADAELIENTHMALWTQVFRFHATAILRRCRRHCIFVGLHGFMKYAHMQICKYPTNLTEVNVDQQEDSC